MTKKKIFQEIQKEITTFLKNSKKYVIDQHTYRELLEIKSEIKDCIKQATKELLKNDTRTSN